MRTNLDECHTHEEGSDTNKSAQALTRRDRKTAPHPTPSRDRGSNPRSSGVNSDALTTELHPPSVVGLMVLIIMIMRFTCAVSIKA